MASNHDIEYANQLTKQLDDEQSKYWQEQVLIKALENINVDHLKLSANGAQNFKDAVAELSYRHLNGDEKDPDLTMLGIENSPTPTQFSFIEKRAIQKECFASAIRACQPLIDFVNSKRNEKAFNVFTIDQKKQEILDSERELREANETLAQLHIKKLTLLKKAAEIKASSTQRDELELLLLKNKLNDAKATELKDIITQQICFKGEHSIKAMEEVAGHLNPFKKFA